jgi:hypothetical protein
MECCNWIPAGTIKMIKMEGKVRKAIGRSILIGA